MKLTVAMRVIGGFAITSLLLFFLGIMSNSVLSTISESTKSVNNISVPAMETSAKLQQQFLLLSKTTLLDYYAKNYDEIDTTVTTFDQQAQAFSSDLKQLKSVAANTPELANKIPSVEQAYNEFSSSASQMFDSKKRTLELADKVATNLEETEFAADDAATYLLDFIDMNDLAESSALAQTASKLDGNMGSVISAITDIAEETQRQNVETIIKELSFTENKIKESMATLTSQMGGRNYDGYDDVESQVAMVLDLLSSQDSVQQAKTDWLNQIDETDRLLAQTNDKISQGLSNLTNLVNSVKARLEVTTDEVTESVEDGQSQNIILIVVSLGLSVFIAINTVLKVTRPLREVNSVLNIVATGDLTNKLTYSEQDEFGELANNCNKLIESLRELINGIVNRSNQLATASEQTSMVVKESTVAINDQRSQVEQAATATTEMSSTSSAVTERANEALADIKHADEEAERVKQISDTNKQTIISLAGEIEQAAGVIDEVNHHSAAIGGILDVIRGIAEQTNLLALNAAIEAARAGEQGRGFAVVADEVRTLASRTQSATEQIQSSVVELQNTLQQWSTVMLASKSEAESCVEESTLAKNSMTNINQMIDDMTGLTATIATATEEQSAVANEININVHKIDEISKDNTAAAEQVNGTGIEVNQSARILESLSSTFR